MKDRKIMEWTHSAPPPHQLLKQTNILELQNSLEKKILFQVSFNFWPQEVETNSHFKAITFLYEVLGSSKH